jgi:N6-L-threonylcarbamoyladenine synthase
MRILGIETSCDETAVAIYDEKSGLLSNLVSSQMEVHQPYGGVVPELASRDHQKKICLLIEEALQTAQLSWATIDAIAFTAGPGLLGALLVGAATAQALAYSLNIPAIPVHHLEGHLLAPLLEDQRPSFPFVGLLVSGGHTLLMEVQKIGHYSLLGESLDDAAGEAFDKVAKLMGLPMPGGPAVARLALQGDPTRFEFPRPLLHQPNCNFSFSGLKTHVRNLYQKSTPMTDQTKADIAVAFELAVVDCLVAKAKRALSLCGLKDLVIAGGVSANQRLRQALSTQLAEIGAKVFYAKPALCVDNAAMIAYAGLYRYKANQYASLAIEPKARWPLIDVLPL